MFHGSPTMQMSLSFLQKGRPSEFIKSRINSLKRLPSALPTHSVVNHYSSWLKWYMEPRKVRQLLSPTETQVTCRSSDGNKENENIFEVAWQTLRLSCHAIIDPHIHILFVLLYFTVLAQLFCCNHSLNTDFLSLFSPTHTSKTVLWQDQNREEPFLHSCYVCSTGVLRGLCSWRGFLIKRPEAAEPTDARRAPFLTLYPLSSSLKAQTHTRNTQLCLSCQKLSVWC